MRDERHESLHIATEPFKGCLHIDCPFQCHPSLFTRFSSSLCVEIIVPSLLLTCLGPFAMDLLGPTRTGCKDTLECSKVSKSSEQFQVMLSSQKPRVHSITQKQRFRLFDLPLEVQRMIFDACYEPWSLRIIDFYWCVKRSEYFSLDRYSHDAKYNPVLLEGLPSPSLSLTCKSVYHETQRSLMKSFDGLASITTRDCHFQLPVLPERLGFAYQQTKYLEMDVRSFVDLFSPQSFPALKFLTIKCTPICLYSNPLAREYPGDDEAFQEWAKEQHSVLERRSRKPLIHINFTTILDPQFEQIHGDECVRCYLAEEQSDVLVHRERCDWGKHGARSEGDNILELGHYRSER